MEITKEFEAALQKRFSDTGIKVIGDSASLETVAMKTRHPRTPAYLASSV